MIDKDKPMDDKPMDNMSDYYLIDMLCSNCGHGFKQSYPKGTCCPPKDTCPNCGCRQASRNTSTPHPRPVNRGWNPNEMRFC